MKKLLLIIITVLFLVLVAVTVGNGMQIGGLSILGIKSIQEENQKLDEKIQNATKKAGADYQSKLNELNDAIKKLKTEKKSYEEMLTVSTDTEIEAANQSYENMIEFLLVRIENHAKSEGVSLDLTFTKNNAGGENSYNLNFTATGTYVGIEEFITDIEDDSKLGYKIEEFKMNSSSTDGDTVQATFICKNIVVKGLSEANLGTTNNNTTDTNKSNATNTTTDNTNTKK